jgi:hypothetical protein
MSDLELPDLGHDLIGIDLEKGIYLNAKIRGVDNESNDSGNNSMNTNGSGNHQFLSFLHYLLPSFLTTSQYVIYPSETL